MIAPARYSTTARFRVSSLGWALDNPDSIGQLATNGPEFVLEGLSACRISGRFPLLGETGDRSAKILSTINSILRGLLWARPFSTRHRLSRCSVPSSHDRKPLSSTERGAQPLAIPLQDTGGLLSRWLGWSRPVFSS